MNEFERENGNYLESTPMNTALEALGLFTESDMSVDMLNTVLEKCYTEDETLEALLTTEDLDNRYDMLVEMVNDEYHAGSITRDECKEKLKSVAEFYETECHVRYNQLQGVMVESTEDNPDALYMERLDAFNQTCDVIYDLKESGELTEEAAIDEYRNAVGTFYNTMLESSMTPGTLESIEEIISVLSGILTVGAGVVIKNSARMRKGKKVIKAYETLHEPTVKYSDLTMNKLTVRGNGIPKYFPELASSIANNPDITGTAYLAKYKNKDFFIVARTHSAGIGWSASVGAKVSGTRGKFYFKALQPEANTHAEYYQSAIMLMKFHTITPEVKSFVKPLIAEYKKLAKDLKAEQKKEKTEEKPVTESAVDNAQGSSDAVYRKAVEKIRTMYESGDLTLDEREQLILEARDRFY